ncbi:hypothetical protein ACNPQM_40425 [Streptomyces sp. NPDC056231]|uniref:hypothetical protein n=1 Tax=Streptomyces sp. NPDC056231 TaxID=3345755 RepID=UPI003AAAAC0C
MQPGEGKLASLVVPVLLGRGDTADNMLTSKAFGGLAKLLEALRAHDARVVEALAEQQGAEPLQARQQGREPEEHGTQRRQRPRQGPAEVLHATRPGAVGRVHLNWVAVAAEWAPDYTTVARRRTERQPIFAWSIGWRGAAVPGAGTRRRRRDRGKGVTILASRPLLLGVSDK